MKRPWLSIISYWLASYRWTCPKGCGLRAWSEDESLVRRVKESHKTYKCTTKDDGSAAIFTHGV